MYFNLHMDVPSRIALNWSNIAFSKIRPKSDDIIARTIDSTVTAMCRKINSHRAQNSILDSEIHVPHSSILCTENEFGSSQSHMHTHTSHWKWPFLTVIEMQKDRTEETEYAKQQFLVEIVAAAKIQNATKR